LEDTLLLSREAKIFGSLESLAFTGVLETNIGTYRFALEQQNKSSSDMTHGAKDNNTPDDEAINTLAVTENAEVC
jgi:hypothetical protein